MCVCGCGWVCVCVRSCGCWHKPKFKQKKSSSCSKLILSSARVPQHETNQLRLLANGNRTHTLPSIPILTHTHTPAHTYMAGKLELLSDSWLLLFLPLKRVLAANGSRKLKYIVNRIYNTQNKVFSQSYTKVFRKFCATSPFVLPFFPSLLLLLPCRDLHHLSLALCVWFLVLFYFCWNRN